ncbi:MAG TPA: GatB/YqeY domain-containing protein [Chloroflexota bacterium]|nr:GatB/YqeY domain-containing protein [Chloroflexota bacterium]
MADLQTQLMTDLKQAMRDRNEIAVSTIRMLNAALKNAEIAALHPLTEAEVEATLVTQIKQRRDSIEQFRKAGREDLAAKEEAEMNLLSAYLPPAPSQDEVEMAVQEVIASTGANSPQDMSRVMRAVLDRFAGRIDGKQVAPLVRQALSANS